MIKRLFIILTLFTPALAFAQAPVNPGRYLEEIQRRQQQDSQDILRRREVDSAKKAQEASSAVPSQKAVSSAQAEGCLDIKKISLSGIKHISKKHARRTVSAMLKPCLNKQDLQNMQSAVQKMYVDKGYIGARVYFDFTLIKEKTLNIVADEGFLENIIMDGQTGLRARMQLFGAFPFQKNKILNLRNIEQGLDQMNKLQSNNVTMDVRPGEKEGGSVVVIKNEKSDTTHISALYDNSGQESTGRYKGSFYLSQDNLISLNDNFFANASTTLWNNRDLRYSDSISASFIIPLGYWTFSDSLSYSRYLTTAEGMVSTFHFSGSALNNSFNIERMMLRGASYKLSLGAQLTVKDSKNYLEDVYLETSSRTLSIATLYLAGTYYSRFGSIYSKLSYNKGLNVFGALEDTDIQRGVPQAQFDSVSFYFNYSKDLWKLNYVFSADAQYTRDDLFSSEQLLIGGEGTVRGFRDESASGENGFYLRNDLRTPLNTILGSSRNPWLTDLFQKTYLGVFADYGYVRPQTYGESAALAGAGAKASYYGKYINANLAWARALARPDYLKDEGNIFYFNIALNLSF